MTEPRSEASGAGLSWARVARGQQSLRERLAKLLDDVPLSTVSKLAATTYELAAGAEGTRRLDGRALAPRIVGESIRASAVHEGERQLLRADVSVRVARATGRANEWTVVTVAFVWSARRVVTAGDPREVDPEWLALGAPTASVLEHDDGLAGLARANRARLDELVVMVVDRARALPEGGWTEVALEGAWPTGTTAARLWLSAPTLEGHRMAELILVDPELTVKLLIEAATDAAAPSTPRLLELSEAWREPLWPGDEASPPSELVAPEAPPREEPGPDTTALTPITPGGASDDEADRPPVPVPLQPEVRSGPQHGPLLVALGVAVAVLAIAVLVLAVLLLKP